MAHQCLPVAMDSQQHNLRDVKRELTPVQIVKGTSLGAVRPGVLTSKIAQDMEDLAFDLWHRKQDAVSLITWAAGRCFRVHCYGEWFNDRGGFGIFRWEELT